MSGLYDEIWEEEFGELFTDEPLTNEELREIAGYWVPPLSSLHPVEKVSPMIIINNPPPPEKENSVAGSLIGIFLASLVW
jgi:hypothetical protein